MSNNDIAPTKPWEKLPDKFPKGKYRVFRHAIITYTDIERTNPVGVEFIFKLHAVGYDNKGLQWVSAVPIVPGDENPLYFEKTFSDLKIEMMKAFEQPIFDYDTWKEVE
jgi:hypothetical protein